MVNTHSATIPLPYNIFYSPQPSIIFIICSAHRLIPQHGKSLTRFPSLLGNRGHEEDKNECGALL